MKRHNISRKITLWQAIERCTEVFSHILNNRQVRMTQLNMVHPVILGHGDMNVLTDGMVPKAVEMLKENMERPYELSHEFAGGELWVHEGQQTFVVDLTNYCCSCPFATDNRLPCRHSISVYQSVTGSVANFPVAPRWTREFNGFLPLPTVTFQVPRQQYAHSSGASSLIDAALYASRRLHPTVLSSLASAMRNFVDHCGPNPAPPFIMYPADVEPPESMLHEHTDLIPTINFGEISTPGPTTAAITQTVSPIAVAAVPTSHSATDDLDATVCMVAGDQSIGSGDRHTTPVHLIPRALRNSTPVVDLDADADEIRLSQHQRPQKRRRLNLEPGPSSRPFDYTLSTKPAEDSSLQRCGECEKDRSVTEDQSTDFWIACDNCGQWYHWDCVFVPQFQENAVCTRCEDALDLTTLVATCKQFF